MTKIDDAKTKIITDIEAKEYVICAEFDSNVEDVKPLGWKFYRINIMYKDDKNEATFGAKGVYINSTGVHFFHNGGVQFDTLIKKEAEENLYACPAGGSCEYLENSTGKYYCKKCLKIK